MFVSQVMFLRHFGILVGGESTEAAFQLAQDVMTACDIQVYLLNLSQKFSGQSLSRQVVKDTVEVCL